MIKRLVKAIIRRVDPTDRGRVKWLMNHPPEIKDNKIVFTSCADYTGNPKALFLYMIEHGYNERYEITWLFEYKENMIDFNIPNVKSALIWNKKGERTPAAQKAIMSARYIFYSHNVNWARKFRPEQTFVDLWHGCAYKANMSTDKKKIYFDYTLSVGEPHIEIQRAFLKAPEGKVLPFGLPVNEFFYSNRSNARALLEEMKRKAGAEKSVVWMPTYRKSRIARMYTDTTTGTTGLPILYEDKSLNDFNEWCKKEKVLFVVKKHPLQSDYSAESSRLDNVLFIDEKFLKDNNAEMYELMAGSDAMVTDYSSAAIDYMLLDKPIGFTLDDFEKYEEMRGFSMDNVKDYMPGHHIYNDEEFKAFVSDIAEGKDPHREWRRKVKGELHKYDDGFSKRILDYFGI